jgi:hypothetical protein
VSTNYDADPLDSGSATLFRTNRLDSKTNVKEGEREAEE